MDLSKAGRTMLGVDEPWCACHDETYITEEMQRWSAEESDQFLDERKAGQAMFGMNRHVFACKIMVGS